ncbi:MAG: MFS transporter [Deltaproteobacteria bacterium]|nr:MFS transporter [Deltaproteobacteria bacterium]MBW1960575.1 MFS transporter [Deltaproteobacteria bacterium]MBW1993546.1 MFS transporter [Deltaproteobacteria bacterium]
MQHSSIYKPLGIFFGISSFQVLVWFRRGLFYSFLSIYLRHFLGLSVTETTLFATLPMIINILCQTFIWGTVSDMYQLRRTLIITGEVLAVASLLIFADASDLLLIYISNFMGGWADVIIFASSYAFASILIPPLMIKKFLQTHYSIVPVWR